MIAVDTSALLAVIQGEPESDAFIAAIRAADRAVIAAVSLLEAGMVLRARRGLEGIAELDDFIDAMAIDIVPFDVALARLALEAFGRYGKGIDPRARLNMGDCAAYALAKGLNAPLLYKGNDFAATDITPAMMA